MENKIILNEITDKLVAIENQLKQFKEIEQRQKELKEQLKKAMEDAGVTKWETNSGIKITLVEDTPDEMVTKTVYNEVKFQEENRDLYFKYIEEHEKYKETQEVLQKGKKGYVRVTLPKVKEDTEEIPF